MVSWSVGSQPSPSCACDRPQSRTACTARMGGVAMRMSKSSDWPSSEWATLASGSTRASVKPRRSEEHTSELQSPDHLVCRLLLEKKKKRLLLNDESST